MFNFLRKKVKKEDPILKEINRQTEELKAIKDSIRRNNESLEADIQEAESLLLNMGYSQDDLKKLKTKDFDKPDEQNRACSGSAMARNRVLKRKEYDT